MNVHNIQEEFGKAISAIKANDDVAALRIIDKILLSEPNFTPGWNQRAALLEKNGNSFDAMLNYNQAIALSPTDYGLYHNRATTFMGMGMYDRALQDIETCLSFNPEVPHAWNNRVIIHRRRCETEKALECAREAIRLDPNYADAHLGAAMCLLELQQFEEGWKEFEWRWHNGVMPERKLPMPLWQGEPAPWDTSALFIYGEQGYGDHLQFMRYIKYAKDIWKGPIYVECRYPLTRLLENLEGVDAVITLGEKLPVNITHQIAMMLLPALVGTEKGFEGAYVTADAYRSGLFTEMMADPRLGGLRVGLCWAGQKREDITLSAIDARRLLDLNSFTPLAKVQGVTWVSLQKGAPSEQAKTPPKGMTLVDFGDQLYDFYDTAALIENLDLVISVDTAVCHLAAAMGKPTWMLSRFDGCWRWFGDKPTNPWYPSMRQYRQKKEGDWGPVIEEIWRALQTFVIECRQNKAAA